MPEKKRWRSRNKSWTDQQSVLWYRLMWVIFTPLFVLWIRSYRALHTERVPKTGGIFLIANHTTGMDPFLLGYSIHGRMIRGPGKVELFESRFFGHVMKKIGMFPIRQHVADVAAVRTMLELYRRERLVVVYPEGGRSEDGELQPFFPEFARLIIKLRARLLPAGIAGGKELLPIGAYFPRRNSPVVVAYGEPFDLSPFYGQELTTELTQQAADYMREKVALALAEARDERARMRR